MQDAVFAAWRGMFRCAHGPLPGRALRRGVVALLVCALVFSARAAAPPDPVVRLETSLGDIVVRLDARKAPITTANFIQYVKSGHYDGTVFHRVIRNFMIQGDGRARRQCLHPQRGGQRPAQPEVHHLHGPHL